MSRGTDYVADADRTLEETYEEPMDIESFVDHLFERPTVAAHASKYVLDAIEAAGTRTVLEEGEHRERYRFFDDPYNDGEHAVLGNTPVLNAFVDDLRAIAAGRGKEETIIWFEGPTATGKSEFKRCLINGLREYSKTPEGRRYTIEWNVRTASAEDRGLSYGVDPTATDDEHWFESPVQTHPLSVFPEPVREDILSGLNENVGDHVPIRVDTGLDPFSREAYDYLEERYRRQGTDSLFSAITDETHLRVKNYVVDVGSGIGVLHAEDDGTPKERLVGSWMHGMLQELDSRGRKNPQAFSYDGVLSQGNGVLTIVEDASQHADLLQKLLNVPDERTVKLDKGIGMDVDTQLLIISNPDLEAQLDQHADRNGLDPLKALKRRLNKRRFHYLTNRSMEAELVRRELTNETSVWTTTDPDELARKVRQPLSISIKDETGSVRERELAPHAIDVAALYAVVTRLASDDVPSDLNLVDKALVFDQGYLQVGDDRVEKEEFEFDDDAPDGTHGIPVTYTRDVIAELLQDDRDRYHPTLDVEDVVMPSDVIDAMVEGLSAEPLFSTGEQSEFESRVVPVAEYVFERQEADVIEAICHDQRVDEETVSEYVEHVYAWETGESLADERGDPIEPDPLKMKLFEVEQLGRFDESDYEANRPTDEVCRFRRENVITALNRYAWEHRDEEFSASDADLTAIPVLTDVLESHDWDDVQRHFPDLDPAAWDDPPSDTETERVKEATIDHLVDSYGYSRASAELTSRHVMREVTARWG
ncbi:PrkA family serine protein kinase [Halovivax gelatinilyticus]|uniref:PrkA family serine protein kinase n=1 Tax=Halovivax gelatinilyticus TaxID=2961597 RepID=UPI0020CA6696|nr:kinase anchor protein [Halovivax gelatinilyticus]